VDPRAVRSTVLLAIVVASLSAPTSTVAGDGDVIGGVRVTGSPFYPDGDGVREKATFSVELTQSATLSITVLDFDGAVLRTLLPDEDRGVGVHRFAWNGRRATGARVAEGPYRFRAEATALDADSPGGVSTAEALVTKARKLIYPVRSKAIVVAIDPGHGDVYSEPGRYAADGTHESEINLDIGLRLRAMLHGAGVRTVTTRTTQVGANTPEWDRNGDGEVGYLDELAARPDIANAGRADLFISIHNNLADDPDVGGPSVHYRRDRIFASESFRLAEAVHANMLARLDLYRTDTWWPSRSHGILSKYAYYVLSPYTLPERPRPSLMPGVLSEGLFLTHPYELSLLKRARVRQSMAAAYYDAVARFVAGRELAARYSARVDPGTGSAGEPLEYRLRVVNNGMTAAKGWRLEARVVPAVPVYDGGVERGVLVGSAPVPALSRGGAADVSLVVTAPDPGEWLVKFDVILPDGSYLSDRGIVALQLPLSIVGPETTTID
jgi:N-acetylmuramoyl-L-alanine amidase